MYLKTTVFITKGPAAGPRPEKRLGLLPTAQRHVGAADSTHRPRSLHSATRTQPNVLLPEGGSGPGREGRDSL